MSSKQPPTLSEKECRTLAQAWQCMESEPKIDYEKLAQLSGYTTGSAKFAIFSIKKKLKAIEEGTDYSRASSASNTKTTPKRKTPASDAKGKDKDIGDANDEPETPSKRGRPETVKPASAKGKGKAKKENAQVKTEANSDNNGEVDGTEDSADVKAEPDMDEEEYSYEF